MADQAVPSIEDRFAAHKAFEHGWNSAPAVRAQWGLTTPASDPTTIKTLAAMAATWPTHRPVTTSERSVRQVECHLAPAEVANEAPERGS
jgi:hypothetical protein